MTIEELALAKDSNKYTLKSELTYSNIRCMRNEILMRGFLREKSNLSPCSTTIVSGTEYINLTKVKNINSAWLFLSRLPKNIIWIINKGELADEDVKKITQDLNGKIRQIFFVSDSIQDIEQNTKIASAIATSDDCVVFTSFDKDNSVIESLSLAFDNYITNM
ncbi:MAG: hypothetical protein ACTTJH_01820 [Bacteroidales bacterium]